MTIEERGQRRSAGWVALAVVAAGVATGQGTTFAEPPSAPVRFDRDILPVLADTCFACHGPDAKTRQADLRLDSFEGATAPRDGSPAIVPGNPQASLILERIRSTDPDVCMPPPGTNKVVTPEQRETRGLDRRRRSLRGALGLPAAGPATAAGRVAVADRRLHRPRPGP